MKKILFGITLFAVIFLISCVGPSKRNFLGPSSFEEREASQPGVSLGLILGPGGAKAFAHAGFLKSLDESGVPISAIVGVEWGSVVGASYAQSQRIHSMDWRLYKLDSQYLGSQFWSGKAKDSKFLRKYFKENFNQTDLSSLKIAFSCPQLHIGRGTHFLPRSGNLAKNLEICVTYPPFLKPVSAFVAGIFSMDEAISYLKEKGANQIVFIDVIGKEKLFSAQEFKEHLASIILWQRIQENMARQRDKVEHYVYIDTSFVSFFDWTQKRKLVREGKRFGDSFVKTLQEQYSF